MDQKQLDAAFRVAARERLEFYLKYTSYNRWQSAKHLKLLCDKLEAVERGEIKRLMVFMPPRHGKSEVVSKTFPAWYLGRNPDKEMIVSSYGADLAADLSRKARSNFEEWAPRIFGLELSKSVASVMHWQAEGYIDGGLTAAGVGGGLTGKGAKVAIIDDPFKGPDDSGSAATRDKVYEWYQTVLLTRLAPGGSIVLVNTRWHEDDLAGRLLEEAANGGEQWEVISFPAIAEEEDVLGRQPGDVLWPERFAAEEYTARKRALGSRNWAALYQQHPTPDGGAIFNREWWKTYVEQPAEFDMVLQSWDCTFKDSDNSDYVVGQVWGRRGGEFYLLDQIRAKMDFTTTVKAIRALSAKWPMAAMKLIEDKANGSAIINTLQKEIGGIIPINPRGSKEARAQAIAPFVEAGNVYIPANAAWTHDFVEESIVFPHGKHDDQVDAMSQAISRLILIAKRDRRQNRKLLF